MSRIQDVIIIYNRPDAYSASHLWKESAEGVLEEVKAVGGALDRLKLRWNAYGIASLEELPDILHRHPECLVFNLVEDFHVADITYNAVPSLCESFGCGCTGNPSEALFASLDKIRSKRILEQAGLPVPEWRLVNLGESLDDVDLVPGLYIVKPIRGDASEGIDMESVAAFPGADFWKAVERIHKEFSQPALIERFCGTRELNVSVLQKSDRIEVLPVAEIDFSAFPSSMPKIVDYAAKWQPDSFTYRNTPRIIPAQLSDDVMRKVRDYSLRAWYAFACRDYIRVDFRLDEELRLYILEVNANPDISPDAGFAAALSAAGIEYDAFISGLIGTAEKRTRVPIELKRGSVRTEPQGLVFIRRTSPQDRDEILTLVEETDFFRPDEVDIAREVLDEAIRQGEGGHYQSFTAVESNQVSGWICFGETPCTLGTYDIYWIAVRTDKQSTGLGTRLMQFAEDEIRSRKGRLMVIETSGQQKYFSSQQFYLKKGFYEACRLRDFYAPGDDKIVYLKPIG